MAFNPPIPDSPPRSGGSGRKQSSGLQSLVQAERLVQIALTLPCAAAIGWGAGWWLDSRLHSHWAAIVGLVLGIVAGMVSAIRMALAAGHAPAGRSGNARGPK